MRLHGKIRTLGPESAWSTWDTVAGSTPGDKGRDPTLEPAMLEVDLGTEVALKLAVNEARAYVTLPNGTPVKAAGARPPDYHHPFDSRRPDGS